MVVVVVWWGRGKVVYLDGAHCHYSSSVSPLFIMTGISVLLGARRLTIEADITWLKAGAPVGKEPKE